MVEMVETAQILNYATHRSLVVLDERQPVPSGKRARVLIAPSTTWPRATFMFPNLADRCTAGHGSKATIASSTESRRRGSPPCSPFGRYAMTFSRLCQTGDVDRHPRSVSPREGPESPHGERRRRDDRPR
jgi:hypothetical protein